MDNTLDCCTIRGAITKVLTGWVTMYVRCEKGVKTNEAEGVGLVK